MTYQTVQIKLMKSFGREREQRLGRETHITEKSIWLYAGKNHGNHILSTKTDGEKLEESKRPVHDFY